ncbi:MAG: HEAT repeat domain-containing protein [Bacteroidota bacterium]
MKKLALYGFLLSLLFACQHSKPTDELEYAEITPEVAAQLSKQGRQAVAAELADNLELTLWGVDSLVDDPVAVSVADDGRLFLTSAHRPENSEFDIRGHRNWMAESIGFQSVEDRRAFLKKTFSDNSEESQKHLADLNQDSILNWQDLAVEQEEVWWLEDRSGDGVADYAQRYLQAFGSEVDDVANGVEVHGNDVYVSCAPHLWKTKDENGDGIADNLDALAEGFAVHIGFGGHGLSGPKMGWDGRIWWGIGDIGANITDKAGNNWQYPNQGVIVRCEPDGSNFEVYAHGLRNTHEFTFDNYGNLITEDNDGDHRGERERLMYLIDGSDSGWRINWQFGKYTDPDNNDYKVWIDEKLHVPRWEGQAAYILPPITNYVNGPTGFVFNPGTALSERWYNHFFVAEFRGSPANSPIHAFTLKADGAGFALAETQEIAKGLLPTGLDFGPDGALYFGDWIDGWNTKASGRVWKLDTKDAASSEIREATKVLLQTNFSELDEATLATHLAHQDQRIRQKAQFELVERGERGYETLSKVVQENTDQLARIHALWGISQLARDKATYADVFIPILKDLDLEVAGQAAKMLGEVRYEKGGDAVIRLLQKDNPRLQLLATEALGRMKYAAGTAAVMQMIVKDEGRDNWLRHAGMIALARMSNESELHQLKSHESDALRMAAVVALRRQKSPAIADFLQDQNELIAVEAARGINDDFSIPNALPALAALLNETPFTHEALLRRSINANIRLGEDENWQRLFDYTNQKKAPETMRAEALAALSTWEKPSVLDRVDGRYRDLGTRDASSIKTALTNNINDWLIAAAPAVQQAAIRTVEKLNLQAATPKLLQLVQRANNADTRITAIQALAAMQADELNTALSTALEDRESKVRATALEIVPEAGLEEGKAVLLLRKILQRGTVEERQAAYFALGNLKGAEAIATLENAVLNLQQDKVVPEVQLDIIEAATKQGHTETLTLLTEYEGSKDQNDPVDVYRETMYGGNPDKGWRVFYRNEAAQCVRCHAIFEQGGDAGPGLAGIGARLTREQLVEAMVAPSARYAPGYEVVILTMQDGESNSGIVKQETATELYLKVGNATDIIAKSDIAERQSVPSAMPNMSKVLSKREIRDVVRYLWGLKGEES